MGPWPLHLFLFETPSLFLPSSIPSHVTACPLQTLPSGRRGLSRLHRVPRPQAAARTVSKPQASRGTGCSGWAPEFWGMCFENRKGRDQGPKEPQVLPATGSPPHLGQTVCTWRWDYERHDTCFNCAGSCTCLCVPISGLLWPRDCTAPLWVVIPVVLGRGAK